MMKRKGVMLGCGFMPSHDEMREAFNKCASENPDIVEYEWDRAHLGNKNINEEIAKKVYTRMAEEANYPDVKILIPKHLIDKMGRNLWIVYPAF